MTAPWKKNRDMAKRREFPLAQVYGLLEPGPVVLVTTARAGRTNIMPMSWHTMISAGQGLIGTVVLILVVMLPVTGSVKISKAVEDSPAAMP